MTTDLPRLLGRVREFTQRFKAGTRDSAPAFRDLVALCFGITVGAEGSAPRLTYLEGNRDRAVLGGMAGPQEPLKLRDRRFLKLVIGLSLERTKHGPRLKVLDSSYQYQQGSESGSADWIFRYDYERHTQDRHPASHLHVRGSLLADDVLADEQPLERVHFPTQRVSFEAIFRLLVEQFGIEATTPPDTWRSVLAEAEALFHEIAHLPLSGPDGRAPR